MTTTITVDEAHYRELHSRVERAEHALHDLTKENEQLKLKARLTELGDTEVRQTEALTDLADQVAFLKNALRDEQFEHDELKRLQLLTRREVDQKQAEIDRVKDPRTYDARLLELYAHTGQLTHTISELNGKINRLEEANRDYRLRLTSEAEVAKIEKREAMMRSKLQSDTHRLEDELRREMAANARSARQLTRDETPRPALPAQTSARRKETPDDKRRRALVHGDDDE